MNSSDPSAAQETRIHEMEVRLAYQDHLLSELDGVVRSFALRVERLERQISELQVAKGALEVGSGDEKPPHY